MLDFWLTGYRILLNGVRIVLLCLLIFYIGSNSGFFYDQFCSSFNTCRECTLHGSRHCRWNILSEICEGKSLINLYGICELTKAAECPSRIGAAYTYNDSFARFLMFPLAVAANAFNPEICLKNTISDAELVKKVTVRGLGNWTTCSAYVAVTNEHKAAIIAFQGTSSPVQFLAHVYYGLFNQISMEGGGKVSGYYAKLFDDLWKTGLKYNIRAVLRSYPDYGIWITGHSMGGTLAVIGAHTVVEKLAVKAEKIRLITFGEPRVLDEEYSAIHDKMFPYSYRVVSFRDPVPHVPFLNLLNYRHHRHEKILLKYPGKNVLSKAAFSDISAFGFIHKQLVNLTEA